MKCLVCNRESPEKYCNFHKRAYNNIIQNFEVWQRATGLTWKEYLKAVVENSYTGAWAKELAGYLLKNKDG